MKHELVELVICLLWNWMVVCSNLDECERNSCFFFKFFFFAWMGRVRKP